MSFTLRAIDRIYEDERETGRGVDSGTGQAQYRAALSNQNGTEVSVHTFASSFKGFSLTTFRSVVGGTDSTIKKFLDSKNPLSKIKKAWREPAKPKQALQAGT
jgi:hypothetical protein